MGTRIEKPIRALKRWADAKANLGERADREDEDMSKARFDRVRPRVAKIVAMSSKRVDDKDHDALIEEAKELARELTDVHPVSVASKREKAHLLADLDRARHRLGEVKPKFDPKRWASR